MKHTRKIPALIITMIVIGGVSIYAAGILGQKLKEDPERLLREYMEHIEDRDYDAMYAMVSPESVRGLGKEGYIERNSKIYEGIEAHDIQAQDVVAEEQEDGRVAVTYRGSFDTLAGEITFTGRAVFADTEEGCRLAWEDSLIHPDLTRSDKIQVFTEQAKRGEIQDRDGRMLAGEGTASSVGIIPGKMADREAAAAQMASLLEIDADSIRHALEADWVREDTFVPVATIPKVDDLALLSPQTDEDMQREYRRQEQLLALPGVMMTDIQIRSYPLGPAASHLIGYVQEVTAEDIENDPEAGYTPGSMIGRSGMEGLYEKALKGRDGCKISIIDKEGNTKKVLAEIPKEDGRDIRLTIDQDLQASLYARFRDDCGCSVAMDPYTGEVLALVSTPSYDDNALVNGLSQEKWTALEEDKDRPLYNRFRQIWCPGSTFKPVVAGIGRTTGRLDPNEDFGSEGLEWQKDPSWGSYHVTTLQAYEPVTMKNALIYSDNIYFAKAALKIGAEELARSLDRLGFGQRLPFEIQMEPSQYSNTDTIGTEIQLADSGYGQGEVLVNPLHLASIYTAFLNGGDMIRPYLEYRGNAPGEVWISGAYPADAAGEIAEALKETVNDPKGTGYAAHREDLVLAGKTGTAEQKATREDTSGTEIGWFAVFTAERETPRPLILISMVEDVKNSGGSGYVIAKDKAVLDGYLKGQ